jgi:two-component system nitrogen regulation sensor histidine kinase NtrY
LEVEIVPENLKLTADEKLMEQVLINLVKNSIEANLLPEGEITIKANRIPQNCLIIQVTDNGGGIDEMAIESIFVPSFTTKENGSGIGLSISRQIIQLHKGSISVKSEPGAETVFEILLPEQFSEISRLSKK